MTRRDSTKRVGVESTLGGRDGTDLAEALRERPGLISDRSLFFDLVQADYRRLSAHGEVCEPSAYCEHLGITDSELLASVRRLVEVEKYFVENPSFLEQVGEPSWPLPGDSFAGFDLIEELGRGAASRVFLARDPARGNRKVALKVTTLATGEADLLGRADRRGVVPIHWHGSVESRGLHWLCMPYHGRRTLQDEIDSAGEAGLSIERVLRISAQLAGTLAGLSDIGVCHGDLKPSNILLLEDDHPMLIDFNLGRLDTSPTALVGGTLPYMAPEVLRRIVSAGDAAAASGNSAAIAADVFSFGCLLFQVYTGRLWAKPKVQGKTAEGLALSMLDAQLDAREGSAASLGGQPVDFVGLVQACLSLSPTDRPSSFSEIAKRLDDLIETQARPQRRGHLGILLGAMATAFLVFVWLHDSPTPVELISRAEQLIEAGIIAEASEALATVTYSEGLTLDARWSLANGFLAVGRLSESAAAHRAIGEVTGDSMAYAMAGYSYHLLGFHDIAIDNDRKALVLGEDSVALNNNLAAGLMAGLGRRFDTDASSEITGLLLSAAIDEPVDPTISTNVLRHVEILSQKGVPHRYPLADLLARTGPCDDTSFLVLGAKHVAPTGTVAPAAASTGLDLLQRLASTVSVHDIPNLIGEERYEAYVKTPGFCLPSYRKRAQAAYVAATAGSFYIDPRSGTKSR